MGNEPRLGSKVFYKIGEVSHVTKLPAYVLRFWESQFPFLKPKKSRGNQRLYVRKDVETVLEIKRMLYEEGYTLEGVKRYWTRRGRATNQRIKPKELAQKLRGNLQAILKILESHSS
jgi:DNA-binding transcriptional MerR regulator